MSDDHLFMMFGAAIAGAGFWLAAAARAGDGRTVIKLFGAEITLAAAGGIVVMLFGIVTFAWPTVINHGAAPHAAEAATPPPAAAPSSGEVQTAAAAADPSDVDQRLQTATAALSEKDQEIKDLQSKPIYLFDDVHSIGKSLSDQDCDSKVHSALVGDDKNPSPRQSSAGATVAGAYSYTDGKVSIVMRCMGDYIVTYVAATDFQAAQQARDHAGAVVQAIQF
jgi:hypothetical protein